MSEPRKLFLSRNGHSGVDITYVKRRRTLHIGGWYDGFVAIESTEFGLGQFLAYLGISLKDCERALGEVKP